MVAIRRVEHDNGRHLYADDNSTPFGGSRPVVVEYRDPGDKPGAELRQRTEYTSWGSAGDLAGFRTRFDAELPQVDVYRRSVGDRAAVGAITEARTCHIPAQRTAPLGDARPLDEIAADYEQRLYRIPGLAQARKKSGSHYTPAPLVECLLDSTLTPLIEEAVNLPTAVDRIRALAGITFVDPACGSGAFPAAAARRIGYILATEDAGTLDISEDQRRRAVWSVVSRQAYGVDLSPMAVELCKLALWLEAMVPDLPLPFLDDKIRHGNGLLGTTPALIAKGIPDAAFAVLDGDDPKTVAALRKQNTAERHHRDHPTAQGALF